MEITSTQTYTEQPPPDLVRLEFWNGHVSRKKRYEKYGGLVTTKHNPCLWANVSVKDKPWRNVYNKALQYITEWNLNQINDTELLHSLRYVAYGYNNAGDDKRHFNDADTIWPGNLTTSHKPKLVFQNCEEIYTLYFNFENDKIDDPTAHFWKITKVNCVEFYWDDLYE